MNKASALSLVSNAILYWNTSRISNVVDELRKQGRLSDGVTLEHGGTIKVIFADENDPFAVGLPADEAGHDPTRQGPAQCTARRPHRA